MKLTASLPNRLTIYFFYDADGIVDDYVPYMLREMRANSAALLVVVSGKLTPSGRSKLEAVTPDILVRENKGYDVGAYRAAMDHYGWENLRKLDELVLMNYTIMGPVYPLSQMFAEMDAADVDFWGITAHARLGFDPFGKIKFGYLPFHIQTHFLAIRQGMLQSPEFKRYWDERPLISTYEEAICFHEALFTKEFTEKGFTCRVYADTSDLEKYVANPVLHIPVELIRDRKCPIFKRRNFFQPYSDFLNLSVGNASSDLLAYIRNCTAYDTDLIWQNILRTQHMADIKTCLQLNYILSSQAVEKKPDPSARVALVMHLYFMDLLDYCYAYAASMPASCDVYITTNSEEKKQAILARFQSLSCRKLEVVLVENRGRDVTSLLIGCRDFILDYDAVCFVHDKKSGQLDWEIKGGSFSYQCFENLLKNAPFVENVIGLFAENPRLGVLSPPPPGYADYYWTFGLSWGANYASTRSLAGKLGLTVPLSEDREPIAPLGTMFWFRPRALRLLFERGWKYEDFPKEPIVNDGTLLHAVERVYPFVAQQAGYYSAWVMSDTFARLNFTNVDFMLRELNKVAFLIYGPNTHDGLIATMKSTVGLDEVEANSDRVLFSLVKMRLKRATPRSVWNFIRKAVNYVRRR